MVARESKITRMTNLRTKSALVAYYSILKTYALTLRLKADPVKQCLYSRVQAPNERNSVYDSFRK